jgi:hypothetical protein
MPAIFYVIYNRAGQPRIFDCGTAQPALPVFTSEVNALKRAASLGVESPNCIEILTKSRVRSAIDGGVSLYAIDPEAGGGFKPGFDIRELLDMVPD